MTDTQKPLSVRHNWRKLLTRQRNAIFERLQHIPSTAPWCLSFKFIFCKQYSFYQHLGCFCSTVCTLWRNLWWIYRRSVKQYYCSTYCRYNLCKYIGIKKKGQYWVQLMTSSHLRTGHFYQKYPRLLAITSDAYIDIWHLLLYFLRHNAFVHSYLEKINQKLIWWWYRTSPSVLCIFIHSVHDAVSINIFVLMTSVKNTDFALRDWESVHIKGWYH